MLCPTVKHDVTVFNINLFSNITSLFRWTLLMYAVELGHYEIVEYLISLGAKVDFDCQMFYPLMACFNKAYLNHDNVGT